MHIRVIGSESEFLSLRDDWNRLTQNLAPMQRFNWLYKWWKHCGGGNKLFILVVEEENEVVGIAPLFVKIKRILKCFTIKKLCLLGDGMSLYLDFLIQQDQRRESVFQALLNHISRNVSCDKLELNDINSNFPNFDLWQKYAPLHNLKLVPSFECPYISLLNYTSYQAYFDQLSKNHKQSIKIRQNKIIRDKANVEYIFKKDVTEHNIKTIANIHTQRQNILYKKGKHGRLFYFAYKQQYNFILDYFSQDDRDLKLLAYMKQNNVLVSYIVFHITKNTLYYWNTAFDTDYEMYAPTKLLINESIKYAFENNYNFFDFGKGGDPYKFRWTNDLSINYSVIKEVTYKAKFTYSCANLIQKCFQKRRNG